jgi:multisubunit Na+/H+ antiporter MnhE subunit
MRPLRIAAEWTVHATLALAAWFAFTQRLSKGELLAGLVAAALAGTASRLVWAHNTATFAGAGRALLQAWRLPWYALVGTGEVLGVLLRHLTGRPAPSLLLSVPFDAGGGDARSQARRALAVTYTTITPNFIVLGIDRERGLLWYHQLRRGPVPRMTRALGARG